MSGVQLATRMQESNSLIPVHAAAFSTVDWRCFLPCLILLRYITFRCFSMTLQGFIRAM
jgi:hypothetical protein